MAFVRSSIIAMLLFQLSLFLCIHSISVYGNIAIPPAQAPHHHNHHHKHTHAPVQSPVAHSVYLYPPMNLHPVHPPTHLHANHPVHAPLLHPVHAPIHPPVAYPVKPPVHSPAKAPVHAPVVHPVKPPVHSPVQPPKYPPQRKLVAVRGVVHCKACKYRGVDTLTDSIPLSGAVVQLKCKNTKYPLVEKRTTDKNGYFIFMPKMLTTYGIHKCNVTLVSSPLKNCSHPTNLHGGVGGASPFSTGISPVTYVQPPLVVYTLQPFAFEAPKKFPCQHK